jgi:hypothetical protein
MNLNLNVNLTNPNVISVLETLASRLDLPVEEVIELCISHTDIDSVLAVGKKYSEELKQAS